MRAPFEPADSPSDAVGGTRLATGAASQQPEAAPLMPDSSASPELRPQPGEAKMAQIKDLYLTAEAIGEDALARHFQQVSERQRQLIREYFDQVVNNSGEDQSSDS